MAGANPFVPAAAAGVRPIFEPDFGPEGTEIGAVPLISAGDASFVAHVGPGAALRARVPAVASPPPAGTVAAPPPPPPQPSSRGPVIAIVVGVVVLVGVAVALVLLDIV
jgi:hypothetical protein